jgi:LysM repeat protein
MGEEMKKLEKICSLAILALTGMVLAACSLPGAPTPTPESFAIIQPTAALTQLVVLQLTVQPDPSVPISAEGQVIKMNYVIQNVGSTSLSGNVAVNAPGATVTCPAISTVGNLDNSLDVGETLVCTSDYTVTKADIDKGSFQINAVANINGINSNQVAATIPTKVLTITKSADPTSYDRAGQQITYTYTIKNSGALAIGPAQFVVNDPGLGAPINCGDANTRLEPNATVTCKATYTITQADMDAGNVTTGATASTSGVEPSQSTSVTLTKNGLTANPSNLTPGSNIQHKVASGEWLWQIARCYGTDPKGLVSANSQLPNPSLISPDITVNVPNVGSDGTIYGPPCVVTYTVQSGDTWNSIAQKYNANPVVLQMVNSNTLTAGKVIKVPINSAGGAIIPDTGSSGGCVDLTRNLKSAGLAAASPTHFNLCGQTDAAGNMKISTIKISQRPEDVGPGGLSQDIGIPVDTSTPLADPNNLIVQDMNYDGNDDFRILQSVPASPNVPYVYFIFDPTSRQFVYSGAYGKITSPEFSDNSQIISKWRESATKWGIDTYQVTANVPMLIQRETWEAVNTTQALHRVMVFDTSGAGQVTVEETIPIPAQP